MTLKQAISLLGGPSAVAQETKLPRTTIIYWMKGRKPPKWRASDIQRIIALAEQRRA